MTALVLAATLVALWPPEADTERVVLYRDGLAIAEGTVESSVRCSTWEIPVGTGDRYHAVAIDTSGNQSAPSNVAGAPTVQTEVQIRRELAGLPVPP